MESWNRQSLNFKEFIKDSQIKSARIYNLQSRSISLVRVRALITVQIFVYLQYVEL